MFHSPMYYLVRDFSYHEQPVLILVYCGLVARPYLQFVLLDINLQDI